MLYNLSNKLLYDCDDYYMNEDFQLASDKPLKDPNLDRLDHAPFARMLAESIIKMIPPDGLVIGIYGEWGMGKSTIIEFCISYLREEIKKEQPVIMYFNPWWFSGSENLVKHFFDQMQISLGDKNLQKSIQGLVDLVKRLGKVVSKIPIPGAELVQALGDQIPDVVPTDINELKAEIADKLKKSNKRILVIIDDMDRLNADEIKDLFKVIKSIADFPNIIYLLAFDKDVVSEALGQRGMDYLEKIVQVSFEIPLPSQIHIQNLLLEKIEKIIGHIPRELYWDNKFLPTLLQGYLLIILKFVDTPRAVVRFTNTLSVTYPIVKGEVNPADFVTIEALRVFLPDVYEFIRKNKSIFTGTGSSDEQMAFYRHFVTALPDGQIIAQLLQEMFPHLKFPNRGFSYENELRTNLRICVPEMFDIYFRLTIPDNNVSNLEMQIILGFANDVEAFRQQIQNFMQNNPQRIQAFLQYILDHSRRAIPIESIPQIVQAFIDLGDHFLAFNDRSNPVYMMIGIICQILSRIEKDSQYTVLKNSFTITLSNIFPILLLVELEQRHNKFDSANHYWEEDILLNESDLTALEELTLLKIRKIKTDHNFFKSSHFNTIIRVWAELNKQELQEWMRQALKNIDNLVDFTKSYTTSSYIAGAVHYSLRDEIFLYIDLPDLLSYVHQALQQNSLSAEQKRILELFIKASKTSR